MGSTPIPCIDMIAALALSMLFVKDLRQKVYVDAAVVSPCEQTLTLITSASYSPHNLYWRKMTAITGTRMGVYLHEKLFI